MMLEATVWLSALLSVSILGAVGNPLEPAERMTNTPVVVCEGGSSVPLQCPSGFLIKILVDEIYQYGLTRDSMSMCMTPGQTILPPGTGDCLADEDIVLRELKSRCNRQANCTIAPTDAMFNFSKCSDYQNYTSQLVFKYTCKEANFSVESSSSQNDSTDSLDDLITTTTINITTDLDSTTQSLPSCETGMFKVESCYKWECIVGKWERGPLDKLDIDCCHLWEGCGYFTFTSRRTTRTTQPTKPTPSTTITQPTTHAQTTSSQPAISSPQPLTTSRVPVLTQPMTAWVVPASTLTSLTNLTTTHIQARPTRRSQPSTTALHQRTATTTPRRMTRTTLPTTTILSTTTTPSTTTTQPTTRTQTTTPQPAISSPRSLNTGGVSVLIQLMTAWAVPASTLTPLTNLTTPPLTCPGESTIERGGTFNWTSTPADAMMTAPCPGDSRARPSRATRKCLADGTWSDKIDHSLCASQKILAIVNKNITRGNLREVASDLKEATFADDIVTGDISAVSQAIKAISRNVASESELMNITQDILAAGDNLLGRKKAAVWDSLEPKKRSGVAFQLIGALESIAVETATAVTADWLVETESIAFNVKVVSLEEDTNDTIISVKSGLNVVDIPKTSLVPDKPGSSTARLVTLFYDSAVIWSNQGNLIVNTQVFSATLVDGSPHLRRQLETPFVFTLYHETSAHSKHHQCVFWDDIGDKAFWSTDGCRRIGGTAEYTMCECEHLTNFAVLLDVTGVTDEISDEHLLTLTVITYAGCIISIVCLLLSFITFTCLKNLSSDRNTIHKNLVLTLMLAEALFLVAISEVAVKEKIFCSILAALLHFLFLCVFAWTCLEGIQLYIMLIEVFEAERSRVMYYYLAGYGIPAVIVGVSAAVDWTGYGTNTVCWLNTKTGFIWSFVGPVAGVMLVNLIMLGIAIFMMYKHAKMVANMKHKETSRAESIKAWIKGAVVLVILLGLTWIFGFLYVSKDTLVMAYIFTVLNSLQGLFIFIFHCFGNEKVQKEYKKYVRRTEWLPDCIRVHYGEHKGLSYTPSHSSTSAGPDGQIVCDVCGNTKYFSKFISRRRKSTEISVSVKGRCKVSYDDSMVTKEPLCRLNRSHASPTATGKDEAISLTQAETESLQMHSNC